MTTPPAPPANDPAQGNPPADPPTNPPADPPADPPKGSDGTDWKAEARKWETRAKENNNAAKELERVKAANMSEQEKAVAEAEKRGRTAAALETGKRLASAELRAAAAAKGVDLTELNEFLDVGKFVDETGEVDTDAISKAVAKLAKLANKPPAPPRGSGDFPGAPGNSNAPITEEQLAQMTPQEITTAYNAGKLKHLM